VTGRGNALSGEQDCVPAFELGGSHVDAAVVAPSQGATGPVARRAVDPAGSAEAVLSAVAACADAVEATAGAVWGAAVPGPVDHRTGTGLYTGVGKFDALNGVNIASGLAHRMTHPPSSISFLNDAAAFALGEWLVGAAAGASRVLGLTIGSGIGSGFLVDGAVLTDGPDIPPGGRVDLLELDHRPLEETVSRRAIRAAVAHRRGRGTGVSGSTLPQHADVHEIAAAARQGNRLCREALDSAFGGLGRALGPVLDGFNPDVVVLGGAVARSWDLIAEPLIRGLGPGPARLWQIRLAALPDTAGLIGAAWHATRDDDPVLCGRCQRPGRPVAAGLPTERRPRPGDREDSGWVPGHANPPCATSPTSPASAP